MEAVMKEKTIGSYLFWTAHIRQGYYSKGKMLWPVTLLFSLIFFIPALFANPLESPKSNVVVEASEIIKSMANNTRGPYKHIRWFCEDGAILPPKAFACKEHGGGRQYAEYSQDWHRLAELGWHVGTVFAAHSWEEFWNQSNNHYRLRELPIEKYLVETDDGWVLHHARYYRGRVQIEDEEKVGHELLINLLQDATWIDNNYLLLRELIKVIPHSGGEDLTQSIRREAQNIAESEPGFEKLRIEVHSTPSARTASHIREWMSAAKNKKHDAKIIKQADELAINLDHLYGELGRAQRLAKVHTQLASRTESASLVRLLEQQENETSLQKLTRLSRLLVNFRNAINDVTPASRLIILDSYPDIEVEIRLLVDQYSKQENLLAKEALEILSALSQAAYGSGLLSKEESTLLIEQCRILLHSNQITADEYFNASRLFNLAIHWSIGIVRHTFAEPLIRYTALEPKSAKFVDDVLRSSVMFAYASLSKRIAIHAQNEIGIRTMLFSQQVSNMHGLNAGMATGILRIIPEEELQDGLSFSRDEIVLLPQTISELKPVAGVLTYGEGNLLSHVQMLARNFGIPNVALSDTDPALFNKYVGQKVVLVVGSDGSILIERLDKLDQKQQNVLTISKSNQSLSSLDVPIPDLSQDAPIGIAELHKELSGKVVGPKAANLGELNRLFPNRVAPAIALPFGIFADHVNTDELKTKTRLAEIYQQFRAGAITEHEFNNAIELLRGEISKLTLNEKLESQLKPMMQLQFGEPGSYGIFIRSDTNVEDLPGFTGAGLSKTVPNVVGLESQLKIIPEVWASVLSPRAIAWRSNLLKQPEEVYASVLLMKSVTVEKSGVLVTSNLYSKQPGVTVSTAWGVGGAVEGETAETVVLLDSGNEHMISQAKVPYQRHLAKQGGVTWLPAPAGPVLKPEEKQQLRNLSVEVHEKYKKIYNEQNVELPWDIEFGFVEGDLTLFQIRPLIERGQVLADNILKEILVPSQTNNNFVNLNQSI